METPIYVLETKEISNTNLLSHIILSFHMDEYDRNKHPYTQNTICEKVDRIIDKISFCFSDGIRIMYTVAKMKPEQLPNPNSETRLYKIILRIDFNYEKTPNFYKIKQQGLLPCIPEYDEVTFVYFLTHGFEPTFSDVKIIL